MRRLLPFAAIALMCFATGYVVGASKKARSGGEHSAGATRTLPHYLYQPINIHQVSTDRTRHDLYRVTPFSVSEGGATETLADYPEAQPIWVVTLDDDRIKLLCKPAPPTRELP